MTGVQTCALPIYEPAPVRAAPEPAKSAPAFTPKASAKPAMDDDDDVMSYFEKIAKED